MAVELNKPPSMRLTPVQEIKLAKPATELYVGQILKTVVVTALTNNQVLININGQNFNAKASHHFSPGDLLEVKVIANTNETVLEVQHKKPTLSVLQNTLLATLPKQAPAIQLLNTLKQLMYLNNLPPQVMQHIKTLLGTVISIGKIPQYFLRAINRNGIFFESTLFAWQPGMNSRRLNNDFKGQCLKLLYSLNPTIKSSNIPTLETQMLDQDPLPLPGAIPQPLHKDSLLFLLNKSPEELEALLSTQLVQVLSRITTHQINHLTSDHKDGYVIMFDLPIKTADYVDVVPIMIKQHKATPMQAAKWTLSFALSLTKLGDLQATVSLYGNNIDLKINAENSSTVDELNQYEKKIAEILQGLGLNLQQWTMRVGLESNKIDVANLRLLDLRV